MTAEARRNLAVALFVVLALLTPALSGAWISQAATRLEEAEATVEEQPQVAIAAAAEEGYCNAHLKKILHQILPT
jgi:hypothetical protein